MFQVHQGQAPKAQTASNSPNDIKMTPEEEMELKKLLDLIIPTPDTKPAKDALEIKVGNTTYKRTESSPLFRRVGDGDSNIEFFYDEGSNSLEKVSSRVEGDNKIYFTTNSSGDVYCNEKGSIYCVRIEPEKEGEFKGAVKIEDKHAMTYPEPFFDREVKIAPLVKTDYDLFRLSTDTERHNVSFQFQGKEYYIKNSPLNVNDPSAKPEQPRIVSIEAKSVEELASPVPTEVQILLDVMQNINNTESTFSFLKSEGVGFNLLMKDVRRELAEVTNTSELDTKKLEHLVKRMIEINLDLSLEGTDQLTVPKIVPK